MKAQVAQKQKLLSLQIYHDLVQCRSYFPCLLCVVAVKHHRVKMLGPNFSALVGQKTFILPGKGKKCWFCCGLPAQRGVVGSWRHRWILVLPYGTRLWVRPIIVWAKKQLDATTRDGKKENRDDELRRNPYKQRVMRSWCKEQEKYCGWKHS